MIEEVAVVVPSRDERDTLPACVDALALAGAQLAAARPAVRLRIVIALNDSDQFGRSDDAPPSAPEPVEEVAVRARTAGGARAGGSNHILATTNTATDRLWLANTDADSRVPIHWLVEMVRNAEAGAHVVLGTVEPDEDLAPQVRRRWHDRHSLVDGHHHVHGANFGIRADVYERLGGWRPVSTGEDTDLARRASAAPDVMIVRTPRISVITSSRLISRAPGGFAAYLSILASHTGA